MLGFPTQWFFIKGPIFISVILILFGLLAPDIQSQLALIPAEVKDGQLWRIISGQLVHTNTAHLYMNLAGLLLVWALHGDHYRPYALPALSIIGVVCVGLLVTFFSQTGSYSGFSGVLHFLLAFGALIDISKRDKTGWLLIIGLILKVAYENTFGAASSTAELIGAAVAVDAHAFGVVTGILIFLAIKKPFMNYHKGLYNHIK
ncbi:rhombosortase [Psychrosphaera aestuarii]|uniref:rhombosortase n=1 Tax=Psychrosphaera aestuarii TaxID=1266052 RepID=UPI001B32F817|nr:rhombosortase [Psychrosphaera aestuarii]